MGRKSEAREQLIESAMALIYARSFQDVTVDDICSHAGVRRGSFHYFFRTKRELALAVVEEHWKRAREQVLDGAFAEDVPPLERIARYVQAVYRFQAATRAAGGRMLGCQFGNLACELSTLEEEVRLKIDSVFRGAAGYITRAVRDAIAEGSMPPDTDPEATGLAILAFVEGMLLIGKSADDPEILARLGSAALRITVPSQS